MMAFVMPMLKPEPVSRRAIAAMLALAIVALAPRTASSQPLRPAPVSDCAAPAGPLQTAICGDAELRKLDGRLQGLERAIAATSARPATFAHRARTWREERAADAAAAPAGALDLEDMRDAHADRIAALEEELRQDRGLRRLTATRGSAVMARPTTIERHCLGAALRRCRVSGAGVAIGPDGGTRILWQIQEGVTAADHGRAGIVLLAAVRGGWRLLGWSFEAHSYEAPRLFPHDDGLLLHVRGFAGGTGTANADLLFRLAQGGWREIETESWRTMLPARLPAGLALRQAVAYDFGQLTAMGQLWRPDDANCCPRGGGVVFDFRIEDRHLRLTGLGHDAANGR